MASTEHITDQIQSLSYAKLTKKMQQKSRPTFQPSMSL